MNSQGQMYINPVPSKTPEISKDEYADTSNKLVQIIAALNALRDKNYDLVDTAYSIQYIVEKNPNLIDTLMDRVKNASVLVDYAYGRYKESVDGVSDTSLSDLTTDLFQTVSLLLMSSYADEYKYNCKKLQNASESLTSLLAFLIEDYSNKLKDLEIDIEVDSHLDDVSELMPNRTQALLQGEQNVKAAIARKAIKADQFNQTIAGLGKFTKALNASKLIISKFQGTQSVLLKQIQDLADRQDRAQIEKCKQKLKDLISNFLTTIGSDWANLSEIWATIDTPSSPINNVDAATARHIRKYLGTPLTNRPDSIIGMYRDITRWNEYLLAGVVKAKQNGGTQDQRSKWYIGNNKVVEDLSNFKALVVKAALANSAKPDTAHNGDGAIALKVVEKLGEYIHSLSKFASSDIAMDLARGEKWVQDSISKSKLIWSQITSLHNSYNDSKDMITGNKAFDKTFENIEDAYSKLLTATDEKDRFLQIKRIVDNAPEAINALEAITVKDNVSPTDQNLYFANVSLVQTDWRDLAKTYSEMLKMAPNNIGMQLDYTVENPPELSGRFVTKFNTWYNTLVKLIDQVIEFAVFYIRVKSLYPMTIGMRAFGSPNGKDIENVKYIESMGALLSEVLFTKSLSPTKAALLRQALVFYPSDEKIIVANKMYDLMLSEA